MSFLALIAAGLLRWRWYTPIAVAFLVYPIDLTLITLLSPSEASNLLKPDTVVRNMLGMIASGYLIYGALYSLSLAFSGALPINTKARPPVPPEVAARRKAILQSLFIMALAGAGAALIILQSTLYEHDATRAIYAGAGIFSLAGSLLGYRIWFWR